MTGAQAEQDLAGSLIVNYHYCSPAGQALPGLKGITPDALDVQLASLTRTCDPLDPAALPASGEAAAGERTYLLTFDDGGRDVYAHALPIVRKYAAPTIIFFCAEPYVEKRVLSVQKTHLLHGRWGWDGLRKRFMAALASEPGGHERQDPSHLGLDRMYRYDDAETAAFKRLVNVELPYSLLHRVLDRLFEAEFGPQEEVVKYLYMSPDEIQRCAEWGLRIGAHTYSHPMLSRLSREEQAVEVDSTLDFLRGTLGLEVDTISYPYGIRGSWNEDTKSIAAARGLRAGFTLGRTRYDPAVHRDAFEIPRYDVNDVFTADDALRAGV